MRKKILFLLVLLPMYVFAESIFEELSDFPSLSCTSSSGSYFEFYDNEDSSKIYIFDFSKGKRDIDPATGKVSWVLYEISKIERSGEVLSNSEYLNVIFSTLFATLRGDTAEPISIEASSSQGHKINLILDDTGESSLRMNGSSESLRCHAIL